MRKVECPNCRKSIYSEWFVVGEEFICPTCEVSLHVESVDDRFASVSIVIDRFASGLFSRVIEGKGIPLSTHDMTTFGEVLAAGLDIARWPVCDRARLERQKRDTETALAAFPAGDPFEQVLRLRITLLDIWLAGSFRAPDEG